MNNLNPLRLILIPFILFPFLLSGQDLIILHSNDLHSRLNGFSPESEYSPLTTNDDPTKGGFSRIASVIKKEKSTHGLKVLTLDAGDFYVGTLFHRLEKENAFQLSLMGEMGYDVMALGNHEFDFGSDALSDIIIKGKSNGQIPQLLLSNLNLKTNDKSGHKIQALFNDSTLLPYTIIQKNGYKIGIFSIIGYGAIKSCNKSQNIAFKDPLRTAKKMVQILKKQNPDLIIALSHSGLKMNDSKEWVGEDVEMAKKIDGIDIIISGHSHTTCKTPVFINQTCIVQAGEHGATLGRIAINFNQTKEISAGLIDINDHILGDSIIQTKIDNQKQKIVANILSPLGFDYHQNIFETDFPLVVNRKNTIEYGNLGPFIADAILNEVNELNKENVYISLIPAGMIRGNILPGYKGLQTTADLFNTLSLGNGNDSIPGYPLSQIFVNADEFKRIVEIMLLAYQGGASKYMYYSGLRVTYNPKKLFLNQVQTLEIKNTDGNYLNIEAYDKNQLFGIVGNSYLLNFLFLVNKMSLGMVRVSPKFADGTDIKKPSEAVLDFDPSSKGVQERKEWISLINYSKSFLDIDNNGIPNIPISYKEAINQVFIIDKLPIEETLVEK